MGCQSQAATLLQHDRHQLGGAVLEVAELVIRLGKAQANLPQISPLTDAQAGDLQPFDLAPAGGQQQVSIGGPAGGPHHRFPGQQPQQHRSLGGAAHGGDRLVIDLEA